MSFRTAPSSAGPGYMIPTGWTDADLEDNAPGLNLEPDFVEVESLYR